MPSLRNKELRRPLQLCTGGELLFVALHFPVVLEGGEELFEKFPGVRKRVFRFFISYILLSWFRPLLSQPFRMVEEGKR